MHRGVVYVASEDGSHLFTISESDPDERNLLKEYAFSPAISHSGEQVAYVRNAGPCGLNFELFLSDADGSNRRRLTNYAGSDSNPVWSPDGARIAFMSDRESAYPERGLGPYAYFYFTIAADGSDVRKISGEAVPLEWRLPVWSPDGRRLAFVAQIGEEKKVPYQGKRSDRWSDPPRYSYDYTVQRHVIYTVEPDGSNLARLWDDTVRSGYTHRLRAGESDVSVPEEVIGHLKWSPDGRRIAFDAQVYGESPKLFVLELDGSEQYDIDAAVEGEVTSIGPLFWSKDSSILTFAVIWQVLEGDRFVATSEIYGATPDGQDITQIGVFEGPLSAWNSFDPTFALHENRAAIAIERSTDQD